MPRKRRPMSEEHKEKLRQAALARKTSKQDVPPGVQEPSVTMVGGVEAELVSPEREAPKSLLERIRAGIVKDEKQPVKKKETAGAIETDLIMGFLPLIVSLLATQAATLWSEEYKECAPTKEEVTLIITPLFRIVARTVEISAKLTENGKDLLAMTTALLAFAFRSAMLSMEISGTQDKKDAVDYVEKHFENRIFPGNGKGRNSQEPDTRPGEPGGSNSGRNGRGDSVEESVYLADGATETDAQYARRIINEAYQQDKQYRTEHGLL